MEVPSSTASLVITSHITRCQTTLDYNTKCSPPPPYAKTVLKLSIIFSILRFHVSLVVQGDSGKKDNILVGDRIGHCGKRSWYEPVSHSVWLPR